MSTQTFTPDNTLPEDAQYGFSYEMAVDINISGEWQRIRFISDVVPTSEPVTKPAGTYEDKGAPRDVRVSESWTLAFFIQEQHTPEGLLPELQKILELAGPDAVGRDAEAEFRWYDNPASDRKPVDVTAFSGRGTVAVTRAQTGAEGEIAGWNVTVTGQGRRLVIQNPRNDG